MPKSHREHAEWTPQRLIHWAEQTGPNTAGVIAHILERRIHPQHGFRACLGILRLGKQHGEERLEAACPSEHGTSVQMIVGWVSKVCAPRTPPSKK
ncbi:Integrase [Pseudomonas syringae pv. cilantro]|uniref:Integrase n=1 Tax=Pseudomonas syringae pv. cilantro TaxID=81035 RepID=A0A0N0XE66_PSESX|nr:Integrase [Pseudomonas syringae pv. cilantro]